MFLFQESFVHNKRIMSLKDKKSELLALKIVAYRTLNIGKDESIEAMRILKERQKNGDTFDFISYIDQKIKEVPKSTIGADKVELFQNVIKHVKSGTF